jgi:hypothetical protein
MAREKNVHADYLKCDCHPYSGLHQFWEDLRCNYAGCRVSWHEFQKDPTPCKGGKARSHNSYDWMRLRNGGSIPDAAPVRPPVRRTLKSLFRQD